MKQRKHRMKKTTGRLTAGRTGGGRRAAILFTRIPHPGRVKTRMMPYLSPDECAGLQACFIKDAMTALRRSGADIFVCYEPTGDAAVLRKICGRSARMMPQRGADLGEKMANAFDGVLEKGFESCVLIGSDIPGIRSEDIRDAFGILETKDVAIGPSADGGYWLIGMHSLHRALFENKTYSHGSVLSDLKTSAAEEGLSYGLISEMRDMDERIDLTYFRQRMRTDAGLRHSCTGKFLRDSLKISVIIPTYNETSTIDGITAQLQRLQGDCEIIFSDGGSTDGTTDRIPPGMKLVTGSKGRAAQMNLGASRATGDVLFFLHCDSELPEDPLGEIRRVVSRHEAGCFGIAFHSRQFFMWTNRVISNMRARGHRIMFGDQGIFMTRELFDRIGGFPDIPIMEDYQLSLTMRQMGVKPGMCRHRIYTSERRYPKENIPKLRLMHRMYRLRRDYKKGVPIEDIAARYKDVR